MKEILETEEPLQNRDEVLRVEDRATWQMVKRYRASVLWSAFVGMAGVNWGMDVLVRIPPFRGMW